MASPTIGAAVRIGRRGHLPGHLPGKTPVPAAEMVGKIETVLDARRAGSRREPWRQRP